MAEYLLFKTRESAENTFVCGLVGLLLVITGCETPRQMSLEEQVSRSITDTPKLREANPSISADGNKLVFEVDDDGNKEVFLKDLETGQLTNISNSPKNDYQPSISANAKRVVFLSDRTGSTEIHMVDLADLLYAKGTRSRQEGNIEDAVSYFEQATSTDPLHIPSHQELGQLYDKRGDYEKATEEFDAIASLYTDEFIESLAAFQESPQEEPQLVTLTSDIMIAYHNLALAYTHKGNKKAAATTYYNLGMIFDKIQANELAIAEFEKGLTVDTAPTFATYGVLGRLYRSTGDLRKSAAMLETALRIDPNSPTTHNNLGMVYAELASQEDTSRVTLANVKQTLLENARKEFQEAIRIDPEFADAYNNLAVYHYEQEDYKNALEQWETVYKISPAYPTVEKNLELVRKKLQTSD